MTMRTITANAERSGKWWAVSVPEIEGLFTQTRCLDQIPAMVRDAAALLTDEPEETLDVVVEVVRPEAADARS